MRKIDLFGDELSDEDFMGENDTSDTEADASGMDTDTSGMETHSES